jgi:hypothetical protein
LEVNIPFVVGTKMGKEMVGKDSWEVKRIWRHEEIGQANNSVIHALTTKVVKLEEVSNSHYANVSGHHGGICDDRKGDISGIETYSPSVFPRGKRAGTADGRPTIPGMQGIINGGE